MLLKNNTGETTKVGLTVIQDPRDKSAFIYSPSGSSAILGVITKAVPRGDMCEIASSGAIKVFCYERVSQGAQIRAQKSGDNISRATCKATKSTDSSYFLIGTALESGKGLVSVSLGLSYISTLSQGESWSYLVATWSTPPSLVGTITGGSVYSYTLSGTTRYRLVPSPYYASNDAFYSSFSNPNLSGLIVSRG